MQRTLSIEATKKIGTAVTLYGWVHSRRDHGRIIFIDLRDITGIVQAVFTPQKSETHKLAEKLRPEWVIELTGLVKKRPENMVNKETPAGTIEIEAHELKVLAKARELPFDIKTEGYDIREELRLKYRYLDLRRPRLRKNMELRFRVQQFCRQFLADKNFLEIETPILTKSTPEGARDFLVPARLQHGKFYALPQSPQQYKQLLMVAGFERYFQFAHVFRDEDLRADRLFEHTQLDLEMSFMSEAQVRGLAEELAVRVSEKALGKRVQEKPFPVLTYNEVMKKYDTDRPDLRKDTTDSNLHAYAWVVDFPMFEKLEDGSLSAVHHPFTKVQEADWQKVIKGDEKTLLSAKAHQYDLVLNGYEVGGGSIREHESEKLAKVFEVLGHKRPDIEERFGHLLEAFQYGVPPHGGLAFGFDRWLAAMLGEKSIREVVALPTSASGTTAVMEAPNRVDKKQLNELGLDLKQED